MKRDTRTSVLNRSSPSYLSQGKNFHRYWQHRSQKSATHLLWLISASLLAFFPGPQLWRRKGDKGLIEFLRTEECAGTSVMLSSSSSSSPDIVGSQSWPSAVTKLKPLPSRLYWSLGLLRLRAWGREMSLPRDEFLSSDIVSSAEELELVLSPADCSSSGCCRRRTEPSWT